LLIIDAPDILIADTTISASVALWSAYQTVIHTE
jgi:hypothetical protein